MNHLTKNIKNNLIVSHVSFIILFCIGYWSLINLGSVIFDNQIFYTLNQSITLNKIWTYFWAGLNHKYERKINIIIGFIFNIYIILREKDPKKKREIFYSFFFFFLFFEIFFVLNNLFWFDYLHVRRYSPTVVLEPSIRISELMGSNAYKDYSHICFPSGHAIAFGCWGLFTAYLTKGKTRLLALFMALLFSVPRVVSGAHWASDVIFSWLLSWVWFSWALLVLALIKNKLGVNRQKE